MNDIQTLLVSFSPLIMQSLYCRNIVVEEVLCEAKEKGKSFPTSDSDVLQSNSNEYGKPELVCSLREICFVVVSVCTVWLLL